MGSSCDASTAFTGVPRCENTSLTLTWTGLGNKLGIDTSQRLWCGTAAFTSWFEQPKSAIKFHAAGVSINTPCFELWVICHRTVGGKKWWNGHWHVEWVWVCLGVFNLQFMGSIRLYFMLVICFIKRAYKTFSWRRFTYFYVPQPAEIWLYVFEQYRRSHISSFELNKKFDQCW